MRLAQSYVPDAMPGEPLAIGSVKTNIGHLEAAAGIAGVIKVMLALERQEIPPNLHFHAGNPHIDWSTLPITVPTAPTPWPPIAGRRLAGVSSFGFSGTNAHVILEEAPAVEPADCTGCGSAVAPSGDCRRVRPEALHELVRRYEAKLDATPQLRMPASPPTPAAPISRTGWPSLARRPRNCVVRSPRILPEKQTRLSRQIQPRERHVPRWRSSSPVRVPNMPGWAGCSTRRHRFSVMR